METRHYREPETIRQAMADVAQCKSDRRGAIQELETVAAGTEDPKVLVGAALYHLKKIEIEYKFLNPTRSRLYTELLNKVLVITADNPIDEKEQLVYLRHYYEYRKKHLESKEEQTLDDDIKPVVDTILSRTPDLKQALIKRPTLDALDNEVKKLPGLYEEKTQGRLWQNDINHQKTMLFIKFLSTPVADELILKLSNAKNKEDPQFLQYKYTIYFGTLLFAMMQTAQEYQGNILSCERSDLYKFCRKALNINSCSDVPYIHQLNFLVDYQAFLREAMKNTGALAALSSYTVKPASLLSKLWHWDSSRQDHFDDAKDYLKTTANSMEVLLLSRTFLWKCAKSAIDYVIFAAAGGAFFEVAVKSYAFGVGKDFIVELSKKAGALIIRGPWGEYIGGAIGAKYEKGVVVGGLTSGLMLGFKYAYDRVTGNKSSPLDDHESAQNFRAELKDEVDMRPTCEAEALKIFEQTEWYRSMTSLPSTKLSAEIRQRVKDAVLRPDEENAIAEVEEHRVLVY